MNLNTIIQQFFAQLPYTTITIIMLWRIYTDGKRERAYLIEIITKQYLMMIELSGGKASDHEETLLKRPSK